MRLGEGDRFGFLFFFDSTSRDDTDEFELEREADDDDDDDDRVRFDGFLFFFETVSFTGTVLILVVTGLFTFLSDKLFIFLCERSTLELDEERLGGFSIALLAVEEVDEERCWGFSVFRDDFTGLRIGEGDFEGKR